MKPKTKHIADEALKLPPKDLADLIEHLVATMHGNDTSWAQAWGEEATRRAAEIDSGRVETPDVDDVMDSARADLARRRQKA
jgi:hypothetical protein